MASDIHEALALLPDLIKRVAALEAVVFAPASEAPPEKPPSDDE